MKDLSITTILILMTVMAIVFAGALLPALNKLLVEVEESTVRGNQTRAENDPLHQRDSFEVIEPPLPPTAPIDGYRMLGERNSGTNYIEGLLNEAFPHNYTKHLPKSVTSGVGRGSFKHLFRHSEFPPSTLRDLHDNWQHVLWIMVVRNPCDWADAMRRKPHHACPPTKPSDCKKLAWSVHDPAILSSTREEFFSLPWYDSVEMHLNESFGYSNVFELRAHKLRLMKQLIDLFPHRSIIVHMDKVSHPQPPAADPH